MRRHAIAGFTLLEAIVTLVIVSLIVTVLMQALAQSLQLRQRLLHHQREARTTVLQEQWFRETVASAIEDLPGAFGSLRGDARGVEFATPSPLGGGGLARVRWALEPMEGGDSLVYSDPTLGQVVILPGPLHDARLAYLDVEGRWHDSWPAPDADGAPVGASAEPRKDAIDAMTMDVQATRKATLPRMIRLQATATRSDVLWLVPVMVDAPLSELRLLDPADGL